MELDIHIIHFREEVFGFSPSNGVILKLNRKLEEKLTSKLADNNNLHMNDELIRNNTLLNQLIERKIIRRHEDKNVIYDLSNLIKINNIKYKKNKLAALKFSKEIMKHFNIEQSKLRFISVNNDLEDVKNKASNDTTFSLNKEITDNLIYQVDDEIGRLISNCYFIPDNDLLDKIEILSMSLNEGIGVGKITKMKSLNNIINSIKQNKKRIRKCNAGISACYVSEEGHLYKCEKCVSQEYEVTDINDFKIVNTIFDSNICSRCYSRFICGGVCPVVCRYNEYYCLCMKKILSFSIQLLLYIEMCEMKS